MGEMLRRDEWAYDDLQLRIERDADGTYRTFATGPDGRTARGSFQLPVTDDELDEFVQKVGLVRRRRGPAEERLGAIKEFGAGLYDALFTDQVANLYNGAKGAALDGGRRLRITLGLSGAPELMRLPWEFLYSRPKFISQSMRTPLVRTLDVHSARPPQKVKLPLRILGIVSSPVGYEGLDAKSERLNLEDALEPLRKAGLVELVWLERPTLNELRRRIFEPDEIHVIHYIGHGAYSEENEAGILVLETPEGRAHDVSGERLARMLEDEESIRLVVLNSCEGARTSHIDPFSGVATSLMEFDIPAVIAMQFEITDVAAIAFSDALYAGLAQGMPIDAAMAPARRAILAMTEAEFGTPVLFLRGGDAHLFDIEEKGPTGNTQSVESDRVDQSRPDTLSEVRADATELDAADKAPLPDTVVKPRASTPRKPPAAAAEKAPAPDTAAKPRASTPRKPPAAAAEKAPAPDTAAKPRASTPRKPPAAVSKTKWELTFKSLPVGVRPFVTELRLQLSKEHLITLTQNWFTVTRIDGKRVARVNPPDSFMVRDWGKYRSCEVKWELDRLIRSDENVWRPVSAVVDGVAIPVEIPGIDQLDSTRGP